MARWIAERGEALPRRIHSLLFRRSSAASISRSASPSTTIQTKQIWSKQTAELPGVGAAVAQQCKVLWSLHIVQPPVGSSRLFKSRARWAIYENMQILAR